MKKEINQEEIFSKIIFESNKADSILDLIRKNIILIIDFFGFSGGAIYFGEGKSANLFINFYLSPEFIKDFNSFDSNSTLYKEIFIDKECFISSKKRDAFLFKKKIYSSLIAVPIFYNKKVIGFYLVAGKEHMRFDKKDFDLMLLAGKEIGSFLEQIVSDISIKNEKQNFQSFFNSLSDLVFILDNQGNILEMNSFASRRLFYSRSQMIKKNIDLFFAKEEKNTISNYLSSNLTGKEKFYSSLEEKDGDIVLIEFSLIKGNWSDKEAHYLIAKDISKTKEVETKLEESEEIYTSLMSNIPNYVIICTKQGIISYINNSAIKILGYKDFRFKKRNILDFLTSDYRKNFLLNLKEEKNFSQEIKIENKNQKVFDVIISGSVINYKKERNTLLIMTDITQRKRAEELVHQRTLELETSQKALMNVLEDVAEEKDKATKFAQDLEKFKLAVENTSEHIVIADHQGILLYANKGAEEMTGFSINEMIGKKCGNKDTWGGLMSKDFYNNLWETIREKKMSFKGEIFNKRKDGTRYVSMVNISPVLDDKNQVQFFVGIERDITKEKEIDKAKSEFVSLASHQLRTPLSIINWYAELLLDEADGKLDQDQKNYLQEIIGGNKRMIDLVGALLNVSRIEMGSFTINPQETNPVKVAESILKELLIKFEARDIDLDFKYNQKIPSMQIDPKLFGIIIDNVLGNAIKYTPDGGRVEFNINKSKKDLLIKISDTGYGISSKDKQKIFTKLYRGENIQEKVADGNGLGLYIVKAIVEQSGGKVWFESEEGRGTNFFITFPLSGMLEKSGTREISK